MYSFIGLENFQEHLCGNYGPRGKIFLDFAAQMSGLPPYPFFKVLFCRTVLKVWILTETRSDRDFYTKRVLFYFDSMASSRTLIEERERQIAVKPRFTDTSLLSLEKENPYIFSKFKPLNTDTSLIRTLPNFLDKKLTRKRLLRQPRSQVSLLPMGWLKS